MDFPAELLHWYQKNKRDLPWRKTANAYVIWLSEIILQQTRVEQGLPYFHRFLERYPDLESFAAAKEDDILKLWQGLGYYSRGRNMLKTALMVKEQYNGEFPQSYEQLIKLKGIGEYTASAIASFSANEARAVVDGNVYRVLARYFGIDEPVNSIKGKKLFQAIANKVLNKQQPGLHNQAIMEFGAMLCKPKKPDCAICPGNTGCFALNNNAIARLPVKLNKVKVRERYFNYFLIVDNDNIILNKRGEKDIWANMYDLPMIETTSLTPINDLMILPQLTEYFGGKIEILDISPVYKHILTHQRLHVQFITIKPPQIIFKNNWLLTKVNTLERFAVPKVIFIFLKNIFNL